MIGDNRVELLNDKYIKGGLVGRIEKVGNTYVTKYYDLYGIYERCKKAQ